MRSTVRQLVGYAAIAATVALASGCAHGKAPVAAGVTVMPNMPQTATVLGPGKAMAFHDLELRLLEVSTDAENLTTQRAEFELAGETYRANWNEWTLAEPLLVRFSDASRLEAKEQMALVTAFYLPDVLRGKGKAPDEERRMDLKENEVDFFAGGFVALNKISDNDFLRTDDDKAALSVYFDGELRQVTLPEIGTMSMGDGRVLTVGDIFPGDTPGAGHTRVTVTTPLGAWKDASDQTPLHLTSGVPAEVGELSVLADSMDGDGRPRAYVSLAIDKAKRELTLEPGQSIRWGKYAVRVDGVGPTMIEATVYTYPEAKFPAPGRTFEAAAEKVKTINQLSSDPTIMRHKLFQAAPITFWGASIDLVRVIENDPTSLSDNEAEIRVLHDGLVDTVRSGENQRHTVYGNNRWWVIEVGSIFNRGEGRRDETEIKLETGKFIGQPSGSN